jgi:hypothetical protein
LILVRRTSKLIIPIAGALILSLAQICLGQDSSGTKSWTSSSQAGDRGGNFNPTRSTETHTESNGRVVNSTSLQTLGPDGRYVPYSQTEKESVRVDATTVRTTERTFGTGPDGQRVLIQESREETRDLPGGEKKVVRTTSNPDANGALQVIRRELVDSKQVSTGVRDTNTTVFSADGTGGMSAAVQVHEREMRNPDGTVAFNKSTQLSDGAGHWNLSEIREGTIKSDAGQGSTKEENVLRPDADGKLAVVEWTVSKQAGGSDAGHEVSETYSTNVPGQAGNEGLRLVQRESTIRRSTAGGGQSSTRQVEMANPGNPRDGLQVTQQAIDIVRPGGSGTAEQKSTTVTFGPDGQVNTVVVDIGRTNKQAAINVDTRTASTRK